MMYVMRGAQNRIPSHLPPPAISLDSAGMSPGALGWTQYPLTIATLAQQLATGIVLDAK